MRSMSVKTWPRCRRRPFSMRWTALHPACSVRCRFEPEESHNAGRYDRVGYREICISSAWRRWRRRGCVAAAFEPIATLGVLREAGAMLDRHGGVRIGAFLGP